MLSPITAEALSGLDGIRHGFFTRHGGVSDGLYASLNVGLGSRDDPARVAENRSRVAAHLGRPGAHILTLHQVHSADAVVVDAPFGPAGPPRGDALVTATPGVVIGALTADCCPVLFADGTARIVAAAHAGWRGAVAGVLETTITRMEELGADRSRIVAAIGPTIGLDAYEVGPDFEAAVTAADPAAASLLARPAGAARAHFDLPGYIRDRLSRSGLTRIESHAPCTYADESRFFSYRRATHRGEPDYGRQISAIVVA